MRSLHVRSVRRTGRVCLRDNIRLPTVYFLTIGKRVKVTLKDVADAKKLLTESIRIVRKDNDHTIRFHIRFGARETGEDQLNRYFEYESEQFAQGRDQLATLLAENQRENT